MARYLLDLGHREFGIITDAAMRNDRTEARREGIVKALGEAGIRIGKARIVQVAYSVANGRSALRKLIATNPEVTAIMCTSDALAIGALAESRALGLVVPRDLSITGYDDIDMAAHTDPPLTTVNVPALDIGRLAADHLIAAIGGLPSPMSSELPAAIVIRGSCAPPRTN